MKRSITLWAGLVLATVMVPAVARAANDVDSLGAAIRFERYQTDLDIGPGTYTAQVDEVGLAIRQYFGRDFSMAMEVGYTDISYDNNPAAANFSPSGAYGRLTARYQWWVVSHFALDFTAAGAYHRLSNSNSSGTFVDRWWSYHVAAGPRYSMRWFSAEAGLVYRHASGDEQSPSNGTQSLNFSRTTNPYLDLDFTVVKDGTVGLHVEGGARQSVSLVFGYRFVSP